MYAAKDFDLALLTPASIFENPMDIVSTESLALEQKMTVLKRWEADARDMSAAQDESMTGGNVKTAVAQVVSNAEYVEFCN